MARESGELRDFFSAHLLLEENAGKFFQENKKNIFKKMREIFFSKFNFWKEFPKNAGKLKKIYSKKNAEIFFAFSKFSKIFFKFKKMREIFQKFNVLKKNSKNCGKIQQKNYSKKCGNFSFNFSSNRIFLRKIQKMREN